MGEPIDELRARARLEIAGQLVDREARAREGVLERVAAARRKIERAHAASVADRHAQARAGAVERDIDGGHAFRSVRRRRSVPRGPASARGGAPSA